MWRCSKCNEPSEDNFDTCWKCGTRRAGTAVSQFQPAPDDPAVPAAPADGPEETAEQPAPPRRPEREHIVELCSAANMLEANALCEWLEEAGVKAEVVGDFLSGGGVGGVSLGERTAPQIWVRQSDAIRAQGLVDQWRDESEATPAELPETDQTAQTETAADSEEPKEEAVGSDTRFRFLNEGFWIAGLVCMAVGAVWAWQNGLARSRYPATVEGKLVGVSSGDSKRVPMPGGVDLPPGKQEGWVHRENARYMYVVNDETYHADLPNTERAPEHVTISYDPRHPDRHLVGSPAPPWLVLLIAAALGGLLTFVGYKFR